MDLFFVAFNFGTQILILNIFLLSFCLCFVDVCGFLRNPQVELREQNRAHRIGPQFGPRIGLQNLVNSIFFGKKNSVTSTHLNLFS